jgi:hypothetical protein
MAEAIARDFQRAVKSIVPFGSIEISYRPDHREQAGDDCFGWLAARMGLAGWKAAADADPRSRWYQTP